MRVIIAAWGSDADWTPGKTPKHLIEIAGQTLLHRTIELCSKYTKDIVVSCKQDDRYKSNLSLCFYPETTENIGGIGFLADTVPAWSSYNRTVILFGDCYYTEQAIKTILTDTTRQLMVYGRMGGSEITGCHYGEIWAHSWYPEHRPELIAGIDQAIEWYQSKKHWRTTSWEVYRAYSNGSCDVHRRYDRFTDIDDATEDFDNINDLNKWLERN